MTRMGCKVESFLQPGIDPEAAIAAFKADHPEGWQEKLWRRCR